MVIKAGQKGEGLVNNKVLIDRELKIFYTNKESKVNEVIVFLEIKDGIFGYNIKSQNSRRTAGFYDIILQPMKCDLA